MWNYLCAFPYIAISVRALIDDEKKTEFLARKWITFYHVHEFDSLAIDLSHFMIDFCLIFSSLFLRFLSPVSRWSSAHAYSSHLTNVETFKMRRKKLKNKDRKCTKGKTIYALSALAFHICTRMIFTSPFVRPKFIVNLHSVKRDKINIPFSSRILHFLFNDSVAYGLQRRVLVVRAAKTHSNRTFFFIAEMKTK